MRLTRRRLVGVWVPALLGLGGCTGRGVDESAGSSSGSATPTETTEPTGGATGSPGDGDEPALPTDSLTPDDSTVGTAHPKLSSSLADVLAAEDPTARAEELGLTVDGSAVLVVVELVSDDADLPSAHVRSVELREGALVQAYVPFEELEALASDDAVRFVRPPLSGSPANGSEGPS